ncbi:hypothetical protein NEFER03_0560 [Nematocida sp. LUAm3]|nr:hypothetical protein NEFER03_0560 [Nematocida sp. LUAm3]KAI5175527.1 hypothetical protein NEFER02_1433 [Nematocida sp. LUAm2]KAI5178443.1 hypothetical protein NEFER01_1590 [Nematocida sp. LUAm1]
MHESNRFPYSELPETRGNDSYINTTVLNALIYEYLIKKNYSGTAKVFKVEGDVTHINLTQGSSALLDWFVAFNDLYNVRSGRSSSGGIAGKIDAILGKHPKEKAPPQEPRYPSPAGPWYEKSNFSAPQRFSEEKPQGDLLNTILEIDDPHFPEKRPPKEDSQEYFAGRKPQKPEKDQSSSLLLKEISKLRLHTQRITTMSICHRKKILATGGMDGAICVVDLLNLSDLIRFEPHTMQISQVKMKESLSPNDPYLLFGSASMDREAKVYKVTRAEGKLELSLFLSLKGHKSSVKSIDFSSSKIYTIGIDGELRIWSMEGVCLAAFALRRTIKSLLVRSDSMVGIGDINSISLFNPENASYHKEISEKGSVSSYKTQSTSLFVLTDGILIFDQKFIKSHVLPLPSERIMSSCIVGNRLFFGGYQMIYEIEEKKVYTCAVHDGMICAIEGTLLNNRVILITTSHDGEIKIWETQKRA